MKASELREKDDDALREELMGLRKEAFNLRMQQATGQLTRGSLMRSVRRNIARIKTVMTERAAAANGEQS
ncbi:MAG: 50S ribosomal protein L29 [Chromatiales bacterium]|jgi:large subunit ribosomal protein L29|nr:50S ribosomal protein L29 [Chromatiales bacterium]